MALKDQEVSQELQDLVELQVTLDLQDQQDPEVRLDLPVRGVVRAIRVAPALVVS